MNILPKLILPIAIIVLAVFGFKKLAEGRPAPGSKKPGAVLSTVETLTVSPEIHQPDLESFGTTGAQFESTLTPQISGLITKVAPGFRVGSIVKKDTPLIWIDEQSYQSLLIQQEANLAEAELAYAEEAIQARQALEDWLESGRKAADASDFVLRKPQIKAALAQIASMKASVGKARADLVRTQIFAPFDAMVTNRTASVGNLANEQQSIGTLVSIEKIEVRLPLTPDQLRRVNPATPIKVTLTSPTRPGQEWEATITRTDPAIGEGQTTIVIAEVSNPFTGNSAPLPIGLFVNATLEAEPLPPSLKVPEAALINDEFLWVVKPDNTLAQLSVRRIASQDGNLFLEVIENTQKEPYRIVSRPLATFQSGQKVAPPKP